MSSFLGELDPEFSALVKYTDAVTVQAVDTNGVDATTGGDKFFFVVEQLCELEASTNYCNPSAGSVDLPGLPTAVLMNDNLNGTYSADF